MKKPDYSIVKMLMDANFSDAKERGRFVSDKYPFYIRLVGRDKQSKHAGKYTKVVIINPSPELKEQSRTHVATFDIPLRASEAKTVLRLIAKIKFK